MMLSGSMTSSYRSASPGESHVCASVSLCPDIRLSGSFPHTVFVICVSLVYVFQMATFAMSIPRLLDIYRFYTYLLGIPDVSLCEAFPAGRG